MSRLGSQYRSILIRLVGSFDSSVHISEEASNAAIAVPWAIVGAISIAGVLGWGRHSFRSRAKSHRVLTTCI